jgi:hypothetical protein
MVSKQNSSRGWGSPSAAISPAPVTGASGGSAEGFGEKLIYAGKLANEITTLGGRLASLAL